jgi:hypothetical protein
VLNSAISLGHQHCYYTSGMVKPCGDYIMTRPS